MESNFLKSSIILSLMLLGKFVYAFSNKNMVYIVYLIIIIDNAPEISQVKSDIFGYGLFFSTGFIDLMFYLIYPRNESRTKRTLENPPVYQRYIYY